MKRGLFDAIEKQEEAEAKSAFDQFTHVITPLCRSTDPETSAIAAAGVVKQLGRSKQAIYAVSGNVACTANELALKVIAASDRQWNQETLRKRAHELCEVDGLLVAAGFRICSFSGKLAQSFRKA